MCALRFNHVSIHAVDMDESLRFYTEVFGMERLPSPDFDIHVEWLRLGDQQLHLFVRETATPPYHHIGLDVDDFEATFVMARDRGLLDDALDPAGARAHRRLGTDVSPRPRGQPRRGRLAGRLDAGP